MTERSRRVQYLIASCVSVGAVSMGCYASWLAPVMPKFYDNQTGFQVTSSEIAWMASISSPGFMAGSFISRFISDKYGRRTTIWCSFIPVAVGTIIIACVAKAWLLYIAKFLWGAGTGMLNTAVSIYLAEVADKEIRGTLSLISRFMFNFGNLLMMTIGPFVSYKTLNYMLLVTPVIYLAACSWIPESPYYYLKEGKVDNARKTLVKLRGYTDEKLLESDLLEMKAHVRNEMRRSTTAKELFTGKQYRKAVIIAFESDLLEMKAHVRNEMRRSTTAKELFTGKQYRKAVIIAFGLKLTQIMTGQLVIQQYLGLIMKDSQTDLKLTTAFIIFGAVRFIVGVMSSVLADITGRRPLLIYSYFGTFLSLAIVGLYFFLLEVICIDRDKLSPYGFVIFTGIILANVISTLGYNSIIVVVPAEIFPLNVKAVAMTSISIFGAMLNFFVARGYQIAKDITGLCGVFWFFGLISLAGAIFSLLIVPETKGKSLKDIQVQLQGDMYEEDDICTQLNDVGQNDAVNNDREHKELHKESLKLL